MDAVDLFCGVGRLSLGLQQAGINVKAALDNWDVAVDVYNRNVGPHAQTLDLSDPANAIDLITPLQPDLIAGGPPCQDFSSAGDRVERDRASLTVAFATVVTSVRPSFFLMENVPRARASSAFAAAGDLLKSAGYTLYENVLDASRYGVPQLRKRFFCFGWLGKDRYTLPFDQYLRDVEASEPMTMKQYLGTEISIENYYRHPRNYNRRAVFSVEEPSPTIRGVNRPVPPNYVRHRLDTADPREVRPLTSAERSRVQTFPASWSWDDRDGAKRTKGDVELMIGNAVPVRLATAIGKGVLGVAR